MVILRLKVKAMKVFGIILLVFAVLNLLVAIMAASSGAPADAVSSKFSGFLC